MKVQVERVSIHNLVTAVHYRYAKTFILVYRVENVCSAVIRKESATEDARNCTVGEISGSKVKIKRVSAI